METIKNYPLYQINEHGEVFSTLKNRLLTPHNNNGYQMVWLIPGKNIKGKWRYIHRLVAEQFIPKPESDKELWVNHIDGNKSNNYVTNLEWTTVSENIQHSFDKLGRTMPKGKDHWNYGKKFSEEHKHQLSVAKLGEKHPKFKGYYITPHGMFASIQDMDGLDGKSGKTIYRRCMNNKPGYRFDKVVSSPPVLI